MPDLNEQDRAELPDGEIIRILNTVDPRPFRDNDLLALNFAHAILNAARRQHGSAAQAVGEVVSSYLGGGEYIPAVRWIGTPPEPGTKLFTATSTAAQAAQAVGAVEESSGESDTRVVLTRDLPAGTKLFTAPPVATQAAQAVAWAWWNDGSPMTDAPDGVCDYEPTAYPQRKPLGFLATPPVADTESVKDVATKIAERLDSVAASATERNDIMLAECLSSVAVMARVMTRMIDLAALSRLNGEKK